MPSRINLPKLSLFSSRHSFSSSSSSSSHCTYSSFPKPPSSKMPANNKPRSPTTPVSPPPRLHLRNILPASPEEPPIMPPPPRTPRAWVWQCHRCQSVYRLGCTRRCLDCSHTYCISNPHKQEPYAPNPKKQRRRQSGGLCGAEFDYVGWEQWGSWRRKVNGHEAAGRCEPEARDKAFLKKRHNCWIDCDSPSECCHHRYELVASEALRIQEEKEKEREMEMQLAQGLDDPFITTEAVDGNDNGNVEAEESTTNGLLRQSSFLWDDDEDEEENERERTEEEEEEERKWWEAITSVASGDPPAPSRDVSCTAASGQIPGLNLTGDLSGSDSTSPDMDSQDWMNAVFGSIPSELQDRAGSRLTVRNFTDNDNLYVSSDSESESDGSGWSIHSTESNNSSVDAGSLGSSCPDVI
ncbi:hypothetical protein GGR55DRAFT_304319 [Xylaria sp. FL0064]|nr:hypothetical protein GGR55DRAFT_304319 [Xylaria sp. FL0064]